MDDHDEQPDDVSTFFDVPTFPQASLVDEQQKMAPDRFEEKVDDCPKTFTRGLQWPSTAPNKVKKLAFKE